MKRILITGHRGFVGKYLVDYLKRYKDVTIIGYDLVEGDDIRDEFKLNELFRTNYIDTVIHLAARAGVRESKDYYKEFFITNVIGTQNLIKCAEKHNVQKFIFFSSSSVLGNEMPPSIEEDLVRPVSVYGISKATGEMLMRMTSIPCRSVVRPFTIYGTNGRADQVIYKWIRQIQMKLPISVYGDGSSKRGYVHIIDLIKGVDLLLGRNEVGFEIFNLGGNEVIELSTILKIFKDEVSNLEVIRTERSNDDPYENWADCSKAEKILNWQPTTIFEEEVRKIIKKELQ